MAIVLPQTYTATVVAKKQLSPKIFWLKGESTTPVPYLAGQYGSLLLDNQRRPLSFASLPDNQHVEFIVDVSPNGVCSQFTKNVQVGETFDLLAPYGRFMLTEPITRPILFIATGSGIAPIRAQIEQAFRLNTTQSLTLLFGNRHEDYAFLDDEFSQAALEHPNFHFQPVLSEPSDTWTGLKGLVTEAMVNEIDSLPAHDVYICGNPAMVKDAKAIAEQLGVPKEQIHFEQF